MSDKLYRKGDAGMEAFYPETTAERVRYGEGSVEEALAGITDEEIDAILAAAAGSAPEGGDPAGAAAIAQRLATPRQIGVSGDAVGAAMFDGSEDVDIRTVVEALTNEDLRRILQ